MKVMNGLVITLEEEKRFLCLAVLLCEQFCRFANEGAKILIKSYFMRSFCFVSLYSAAVKCQAKLLPFGVNYRLQLAGLGKKREETVKPTCFSLLYVESDFGTTDTTDKSFTALTFIWLLIGCCCSSGVDQRIGMRCMASVQEMKYMTFSQVKARSSDHTPTRHLHMLPSMRTGSK